MSRRRDEAAAWIVPTDPQAGAVDAVTAPVAVPATRARTTSRCSTRCCSSRSKPARCPTRPRPCARPRSAHAGGGSGSRSPACSRSSCSPVRPGPSPCTGSSAGRARSSAPICCPRRPPPRPCGTWRRRRGARAGSAQRRSATRSPRCSPPGRSCSAASRDVSSTCWSWAPCRWRRSRPGSPPERSPVPVRSAAGLPWSGRGVRRCSPRCRPDGSARCWPTCCCR